MLDWRGSGTFALVLALGCGPSGQMAGGGTESDTDTDTDTDTETGGGTGGTTPNPTTTPPDDTSPPPDTTSPPPGDSTTDTPADTGDCPFGTEGCLCDVGAMCEGDLICEDGMCVGQPACRQLDMRPHGDEASALPLRGLSCGNSMELPALGTIAGPETDWYTYEGTEGFGFCGESPSAAVTGDLPLTVCVFVDCIEGSTVGVNCDDGDAADSPEGRPGCCGLDLATIGGYDCMGLFVNKDANVFVSVGSEMPICVDYDLAYSF